MGRPTKLDDLIAKRICDAVAAGNTYQCAAGLAGIAYASLKLWVVKGKRGDPTYSAFSARLAKASADAEAKMVGCLVGAATAPEKPSWQAAAAWLRIRRATWREPPEPKVEEPTLEHESEDELKQAVLEWAAEMAKTKRAV